MPNTAHLSIHNFAQIAEAAIGFGDLTVLVGAQGTGKSLALQWLKTAIDGKQIVTMLRDAGQQTSVVTNS
jgi:DNA repair ATPase RecN